MAKVNWINGTINPPENGKYYVILEARQDIKDPITGEILKHTGDIVIDDDWYDKESGCWQFLGKNTTFWKVLSWANVLKPDVPENIKPRLRTYFGAKVKCEDGKWLTENRKS